MRCLVAPQCPRIKHKLRRIRKKGQSHKSHFTLHLAVHVTHSLFFTSHLVMLERGDHEKPSDHIFGDGRGCRLLRGASRRSTCASGPLQSRVKCRSAPDTPLTPEFPKQKYCVNNYIMALWLFIVICCYF